MRVIDRIRALFVQPNTLTLCRLGDAWEAKVTGSPEFVREAVASVGLLHGRISDGDHLEILVTDEAESK